MINFTKFQQFAYLNHSHWHHSCNILIEQILRFFEKKDNF